MITVVGATGHTGNEITRLLLDAGEPVRALGRSEHKLAQLAGAGAEPRSGEATDPAFLTAAFRGADAVFTLLPIDPSTPDYHASQNRIGEAIVTAIHDAGVCRVVFLSSVGADLPAGTGFVTSLHAQEQRLRQIAGMNVLILRSAALFKNFYATLDLIRQEGIIADSVSPDVRIPMIATVDVAQAAAEALMSRDWTGVVVRELLGQRDLSYVEATRIIGAQIGKPDLPYVQLSDADLAAALVKEGFSENMAGMQVELNRAISDGSIRSRQGRTPETTTPTCFEDFAAELARAYQAG